MTDGEVKCEWCGNFHVMGSECIWRNQGEEPK